MKTKRGARFGWKISGFISHPSVSSLAIYENGFKPFVNDFAVMAMDKMRVRDERCTFHSNIGPLEKPFTCELIEKTEGNLG